MRTILTNEKYIGNNVVGQVSARLYTRQVSKPRDQWTRCDGAFEPIVPKHLFEAAESVRRFNEKVYVSREEVMKGLRAALRCEGRLSAEIINRAPQLPSANTVGLRFGSLSRAYEAMGYEPPKQYRHHALQGNLKATCTAIQQELLALLEGHEVTAWSRGPGTVLLGDFSSLQILTCRRQLRHKYDSGWRINYQRGAQADFVLGVRLNEDLHTVLDFLLVPDLVSLPLFLRSSHYRIVEPYSYQSLESVAKKLADSRRRQITPSGSKIDVVTRVSHKPANWNHNPAP